MLFKMDTDAVRGMAARFRNTADQMEMSLTSIQQNVRGAPWQSQAREEFIVQLELLHNSTLQSAEILRMMGTAAEQKASQWEAIGNTFNGPWQAMGNAWGQLKSMMGWLWSRIKNALRGIRWPSVPKWLFPAVTGVATVNWFRKIMPSWEWKSPAWWPSNQEQPHLRGDILGQQVANEIKTKDLSSNNDLMDMDLYPIFDEMKAAELRLQEIDSMNLFSREQISDKISEIDDQIAHCEEQLRIAQKESKKLINKSLKQDGKTLSEIYDGVASDYERQIEQLKGLKSKYQDQLSLHDEADYLRVRIKTADQLINEKLPIYDGINPAKGMNSTHGKPGQHPLEAQFKNDKDHRDARFYDAVINQFGVQTNQRYAADKHTYCNTFAGDVARAMDVPFPKKSEWGINPRDPATIGFPDLYEYFTDSSAPKMASNDGWRQIGTDNLTTLQAHVNSGKMAVVITDGHIAVVRPDQIITEFKSIELAQAGATNSNSITVGKAFSTPIKNGEQPLIYIID